MSSSQQTSRTDSGDNDQDTYLDPNETVEEYAEENPNDNYPMSSDDENEDMEVIVDDSIQGFFLHTSSLYSVALYDNWVATGGGDDLGYLWDITSGEMIMKLDGHTDSVTNVAFSNDGAYLATGGMDGQVRIWSVREKKLVVALEAGDEVLVFSPLQTLLIGSGWIGTLQGL
jgi:WD40 repeat protein